MLFSQNQLARELEFFSRVAITVGGKPATDHDRRQFITVQLLRVGLECDFLGLDCALRSQHRRELHKLVSVDLLTYARDVKFLKAYYLQNALRDPEGYPWRRFKRDVADKIQNHWILGAMANLYSQPHEGLTWLSFDERLLLDTNDDVSGEIESYVQYEVRLSSLDYEEWLVEALNSILADWYWDFSFASYPIGARFGPGAVADGRGRLPVRDKAKLMTFDSETVSSITQFWDVTVDDFIIGEPGIANFTNRIIFVPKNALTHRIISAEPAWLTWLQQAIKSAVYPYVENHPRMATWFSDQGRSRALCVKGSVNGLYSTIDLSNASDAITVKLVDRLFQGTPLHDPLLFTRSRYAEMPDGRVLELNKFAPMGSACCFLVLDSIMLSCCELATRLSTGRGYRTGDYVVYGDDIIIRTEFVPYLLDILDRLHFSVNEDKSYFAVNSRGHHYRESCGCEAYDGVDITPLRYSRYHEPVALEYSHQLSETYVSQNVSLLNTLCVEGMFQTRSVLWGLISDSASRRKTARHVWNSMLRVDRSDYLSGWDGPWAIVTPDGTATNYRVRSRFNRDLWRQEYFCPCPRSRPAPREQDELEFLLWCFAAEAEEPKDNVSSQDLLSTVAGHQPWKYGWRWLAGNC